MTLVELRPSETTMLVVCGVDLPAVPEWDLPRVDVVLATPARLHHPEQWPAAWYWHANGVVALIECAAHEIAAVVALLLAEPVR